MSDNTTLLIGCGIIFFITVTGFVLIVSGVRNKGKTVNIPCPKCNHPQSIAKPGFAVAETDEFKPTSELVTATMYAVIGGFLAFGGLLILLLGGGINVTTATALIGGAGMLIPNINKILTYNSIKRDGEPATIFRCAKCFHQWYQQENPS